MTKWYKQKTTWSGLAAVVTGIGMIVAGEVTGGIQMLATGVVAVFLRQGVAKLT